MNNPNKVAGDLISGKVNFDYLKKNPNMDIADLVKLARKNRPGYVEDDDSDASSYYEEIIEEEIIEDDLSLLKKKPAALPVVPTRRGSLTSLPKPAAPAPAPAQKPLLKKISPKKKKKKEIDPAKLLLLQSAEQKLIHASNAFKDAIKEGAAIVSLLENMCSNVEWDEDEIEEVDPDSWEPRSSFIKTVQEAQDMVDRLENAKHTLMGTHNKGAKRHISFDDSGHDSNTSYTEVELESPQANRKLYIPTSLMNRESSFRVPDLATLEEEDTDQETSRHSESDEELEKTPTTKKPIAQAKSPKSPLPIVQPKSPLPAAKNDELSKAKSEMLKFAEEGKKLASKLQSPKKVTPTVSMPAKAVDDLAKAKESMLQFAKEGAALASKLEKPAPKAAAAETSPAIPPPIPTKKAPLRTNTSEYVVIEDELEEAKNALLRFAKEGAALASKLEKKAKPVEAPAPATKEAVKEVAPLRRTNTSEEFFVEDEMEKAKKELMQFAKEGTALASKLEKKTGRSSVPDADKIVAKEEDEMAKAKQAMMQFAQEGKALASKLSADKDETKPAEDMVKSDTEKEIENAKKMFMEAATQGASLVTALESKIGSASSKQRESSTSDNAVDSKAAAEEPSSAALVQDDVHNARKSFLMMAQQGADLVAKLENKLKPADSGDTEEVGNHENKSKEELSKAGDSFFATAKESAEIVSRMESKLENGKGEANEPSEITKARDSMLVAAQEGAEIIARLEKKLAVIETTPTDSKEALQDDTCASATASVPEAQNNAKEATEATQKVDEQELSSKEDGESEVKAKNDSVEEELPNEPEAAADAKEKSDSAVAKVENGSNNAGGDIEPKVSGDEEKRSSVRVSSADILALRASATENSTEDSSDEEDEDGGDEEKVGLAADSSTTPTAEGSAEIPPASSEAETKKEDSKSADSDPANDTVSAGIGVSPADASKEPPASSQETDEAEAQRIMMEQMLEMERQNALIEEANAKKMSKEAEEPKNTDEGNKNKGGFFGRIFGGAEPANSKEETPPETPATTETAAVEASSDESSNNPPHAENKKLYETEAAQGNPKDPVDDGREKNGGGKNAGKSAEESPNGGHNVEKKPTSEEAAKELVKAQQSFLTAAQEGNAMVAELEKKFDEASPSNDAFEKDEALMFKARESFMVAAKEGAALVSLMEHQPQQMAAKDEAYVLHTSKSFLDAAMFLDHLDKNASKDGSKRGSLFAAKDVTKRSSLLALLEGSTVEEIVDEEEEEIVDEDGVAAAKRAFLQFAKEGSSLVSKLERKFNIPKNEEYEEEEVLEDDEEIIEEVVGSREDFLAAAKADFLSFSKGFDKKNKEVLKEQLPQVVSKPEEAEKKVESAESIAKNTEISEKESNVAEEASKPASVVESEATKTNALTTTESKSIEDSTSAEPVSDETAKVNVAAKAGETVKDDQDEVENGAMNPGETSAENVTKKSTSDTEAEESPITEQAMKLAAELAAEAVEVEAGADAEKVSDASGEAEGKEGPNAPANGEKSCPENEASVEPTPSDPSPDEVKEKTPLKENTPQEEDVVKTEPLPSEQENPTSEAITSSGPSVEKAKEDVPLPTNESNEETQGEGNAKEELESASTEPQPITGEANDEPTSTEPNVDEAQNPSSPKVDETLIEDVAKTDVEQAAATELEQPTCEFSPAEDAATEDPSSGEAPLAEESVESPTKEPQPTSETGLAEDGESPTEEPAAEDGVSPTPEEAAVELETKEVSEPPAVPLSEALASDSTPSEEAKNDAESEVAPESDSNVAEAPVQAASDVQASEDGQEQEKTTAAQEEADSKDEGTGAEGEAGTDEAGADNVEGEDKLAGAIDELEKLLQPDESDSGVSV